VTDEGKEKKVNIDFEPFKPINTSLYLCDNKVGVIQCVLMRQCRGMALYICSP
jgi:peptide subunit release factor 1 (eRF1)